MHNHLFYNTDLAFSLLFLAQYFKNSLAVFLRFYLSTYVFVINFILMHLLFYQLMVGLQSVCTLCVSSYQSMFMFSLSCKCNFRPCLSEIIFLYAHQYYGFHCQRMLVRLGVCMAQKRYQQIYYSPSCYKWWSAFPRKLLNFWWLEEYVLGLRSFCIFFFSMFIPKYDLGWHDHPWS